MAHILSQGLKSVRKVGDSSEKLDRQIQICNDIIGFLKGLELDGLDNREISPLAKRLLALEESRGRSFKNRPDSPLALGCLFTGTRQDLSLVSQLKKEILTANRIDILCSFIKWTGIRVIQPELEQFTACDGVRLRIITTSYMGATDLKAVEFLESLPNTQLKVSYDTHRTRLHAKAYHFQRDTGFDTAYIGSANISHAALTDGLEWNVKVSGYEQRYLLEKVASTFETYWNDKEFELYQKGERVRLGDALAAERGGSSSSEFDVPFFELRPYTFQQEVLERIEVERSVHNRFRHLVVAATGTGKTMIAAFDYRQWRDKVKRDNPNREPRFLFVAHREEILKQALYTYRAVLRDQNFGDLLVAGHKPAQLDQLFVSIQSLNARELEQETSSTFYDYIVVDEFHHACAPSYSMLLEYYKPVVLLGLTATPERADGHDIYRYFGGHVSAEIRLPNAINRKLLCPFQYFGISDSIDYSQVKWRSGGYDRNDLDNILTGDMLRASRIFEKAVETVLDIRRVKGLGFCVSKAHAAFMCKVFCEKGIPSVYLTAESATAERNTVKKRLCDGEINFIFVVDLFNEGVDIPSVDTVLFLRPTDSLTVFLQQLGRGLRLDDAKDCLTVLDFVGQSHRNFRYDILFRALLNSEAGSLDQEIDAGFPHLPSGCTITLERKAREYILENIRRSIASNRSQIVQRIGSFSEESRKELTLGNFLEFHRLETDDIYRRATWSRLCQQAGVLKEFKDPDEQVFEKGLRRFQHIDDLLYMRVILKWIEEGCSMPGEDDQEVARRLQMLYFALLGEGGDVFGLAKLADLLKRNQTLRAEFIDLLKYKASQTRHLIVDLQLPFFCPIQLHSQYLISEIRAALGHLSTERITPFREGVLHVKDLAADLFFVTLNKTDARYSPSTMYEDYAIDESHFHWQSQSVTSVASNTGQRYIDHEKNGHTILLFVREHAKVSGRAMPFSFLGPAIYQSHSGERPISFVWKLVYPMPADLQIQTERLAIF
jgi:superfamily II DNA or RNA helicase